MAVRASSAAMTTVSTSSRCWPRPGDASTGSGRTWWPESASVASSGGRRFRRGSTPLLAPTSIRRDGQAEDGPDRAGRGQGLRSTGPRGAIETRQPGPKSRRLAGMLRRNAHPTRDRGRPADQQSGRITRLITTGDRELGADLRLLQKIAVSLAAQFLYDECARWSTLAGVSAQIQTILDSHVPFGS
jgi:hypothetical protein